MSMIFKLRETGVIVVNNIMFLLHLLLQSHSISSILVINLFKRSFYIFSITQILEMQPYWETKNDSERMSAEAGQSM